MDSISRISVTMCIAVCLLHHTVSQDTTSYSHGGHDQSKFTKEYFTFIAPVMNSVQVNCELNLKRMEERMEEMVDSFQRNMTERIDSQQERVDSQQERIDSQQERVDSQQGRVDSQQERIDSQQERIDSQQEMIDSQQEMIDSQQERIDSQRERIDSQQERIDSQQERIDSQQEWIARIESVSDIRLITAATVQPNPSENAVSGRLEVYLNGQWGTVCDDHFADVDASVACKQLGGEYNGTGKVVSASATTDGTGHIWLDNVGCTGSEDSLLQCSHTGIGVHDCAHDEDVGVKCYKK